MESAPSAAPGSESAIKDGGQTGGGALCITDLKSFEITLIAIIEMPVSARYDVPKHIAVTASSPHQFVETPPTPTPLPSIPPQGSGCSQVLALLSGIRYRQHS